jgi:thioredoxin 1
MCVLRSGPVNLLNCRFGPGISNSITMNSFSEIINSDQPTLVDFSATWCGPCQMMAPILKELASEINGSARILKVDVDQNPAAATAYQVQGVPTLILFRKGKILWRQSGVVPANHLKEIIRQYS